MEYPGPPLSLPGGEPHIESLGKASFGEEIPKLVEPLVLNEPHWRRGMEPELAWHGACVRVGTWVPKEVIFPSLNLGQGFQGRWHGLIGGKKESVFEVIFLVQDLHEEHFLLISLSRHRNPPTGLVSSSSNFPCSATLAKGGEQGWKLIPAIM